MVFGKSRCLTYLYGPTPCRDRGNTDSRVSQSKSLINNFRKNKKKYFAREIDFFSHQVNAIRAGMDVHYLRNILFFSFHIEFFWGEFILLCSPVFTPQMVGGETPLGFVTEKLSVRHWNKIFERFFGR